MNPTTIRLSKHFLLSDFMGNHSIYTKGIANDFNYGSERSRSLRLGNGTALCQHALEPILERHGPLSISYGFISDDVSHQIVKYQDPDKPSHHRWDLGAAADICVHGWTNGDPEDDTLQTAPISLAHAIDGDTVPYSRLISYSESPYLCIAVSAREIEMGAPRKAFYENRYSGSPKVKPDYFSRPSVSAREKSISQLQSSGLKHGWRGAGYPTYHGGGRRQVQHVRVSKYTMLSDWLFDLQSIANGYRNIPNLSNPRLWATFCAVGDAYDTIIEKSGHKRMSIIKGFVSHANPSFDPNNDWRTGKATFSLVPPEGASIKDIRLSLLFGDRGAITGFGRDDNVLDITVEI